MKHITPHVPLIPVFLNFAYFKEGLYSSVMVTLAIYSLKLYVNFMVSDNLMPTELLACVAAVYTA